MKHRCQGPAKETIEECSSLGATHLNAGLKKLLRNLFGYPYKAAKTVPKCAMSEAGCIKGDASAMSDLVIRIWN